MKYTAKCPVCSKEFIAHFGNGHPYCSVYCQFHPFSDIEDPKVNDSENIEPDTEVDYWENEGRRLHSLDGKLIKSVPLKLPKPKTH